MSRHALPRPVRGPFPGPDGAYIILSSSRSCDVLIELYGSGLVVWTLQFPRTIKDETPLRSHNLCMLRRWRRWRRDWRSSNRRLSIASDLLSLFCPLLGTHTHAHLSTCCRQKPKKGQKKLLKYCFLTAACRRFCKRTWWLWMLLLAKWEGRQRITVQLECKRRARREGARGRRVFGTEKVLGRKTSFKFEIFFAAGVFITLHGFELCC